MIRRPPSTTRTATPCPYTTLFRSLGSPRPGLVPGHAAPVAILGLRLCVDVVHRRGRDARPAPRRARTLNGMFVTGTDTGVGKRSEEHTSELQSLMRISYAVFFLKKKK